MATDVATAKLDGPTAFKRWQTARTTSLKALTDADPTQPLAWAAAPLRPRTLATTRLAEHWAHALDVTQTLAIDLPDTDRLRHVAWLGHATLPYAFQIAHLKPIPIYTELQGPTDTTRSFGPFDAPTRITGPAGDFCRVGARRMLPESSQLHSTGPHSIEAISLLGNWPA